MSFTIAKPQEGGTERNRGGRPRDPNKLIFKSVGLKQSVWDWVGLWMPTVDNPTATITEAIERAMKFWPQGPEVFGHQQSGKPRKKPIPRAVGELARERGISRQEAISTALEEWAAARQQSLHAAPALQIVTIEQGNS